MMPREPLLEVWRVWGGKTYTYIKLTKAEHNDSTPVVVFAIVANMWRFMESDTSSYALCGHFLRDSLGADLRRGGKGVLTRYLP